MFTSSNVNDVIMNMPFIGIQQWYITAWDIAHERHYISTSHLDGGGLGAGLEGVGQATLAAVLAVLVEGHLQRTTSRLATVNSERKEGTYEDTSTALGGGALTTEALDLAVRLDLVVLQDGHLDFLALMLDLLGGLHAGKTVVSGIALDEIGEVDVRCRFFSCASWHHHGGGAPSEEWIPFGCCSR